MATKRSAEARLGLFFSDVLGRTIHTSGDWQKYRRLLKAVKAECAERACESVLEHFDSRGYDRNDKDVRPATCSGSVRAAILRRP